MDGRGTVREARDAKMRGYGEMRWAGGIVLVVGAAALLAACNTTTAPAPRPPMIVAPVSCSDFSISIYFEALSAKLSPDAATLIDAAVKQSRGCQVTKVTVVGLADAVGAPDANMKLSESRAASVTKALAHRGMKSVEFDVTARGSQGAETQSGLAKPNRRRVDVTFHLAVPSQPAGRPS